MLTNHRIFEDTLRRMTIVIEVYSQSAAGASSRDSPWSREKP